MHDLLNHLIEYITRISVNRDLPLFTVEEAVLQGGFGSQFLNLLMIKI